jgi:hypothetical protein
MLIANYLYQLPSIGERHNYLEKAILDGWQWTGIAQFQSASPMTVNGSRTLGAPGRREKSVRK